MTTHPEFNEQDLALNTPIDISDILGVCKSYAVLGWQIQNQVELLMEVGVEEAIRTGAVMIAALPHIKEFLRQVVSNPLFGDAADQAQSVIVMIDWFVEEHPEYCQTTIN